jgi:hypothetical protein
VPQAAQRAIATAARTSRRRARANIDIHRF